VLNVYFVEALSLSIAVFVEALSLSIAVFIVESSVCQEVVGDNWRILGWGLLFLIV
jgi:hypothetical protein